MKNLVFVLGCLMVMLFIACGQRNQVTEGTTIVEDTVVIDTTTVDTVVVDTLQ